MSESGAPFTIRWTRSKPLPKDSNIHAKEYQLYLPSKELLKQKLEEWSVVETR